MVVRVLTHKCNDGCRPRHVEASGADRAHDEHVDGSVVLEERDGCYALPLRHAAVQQGRLDA
jgi:hypothetical protein